MTALAVAPFPIGKPPQLVKPYSIDLAFVSVALLLFFAMWLNRRDKAWPLWCLAASGPAAVLISYPAVLVAASIGLALLGLVWRSRRARLWTPVLIFNLLAAGAFLAHFWFITRIHLASPIGPRNTAASMDWYWSTADCFPPGNPLHLLWWCFSVFAGELAALPIGSSNGGSIVTLLICLIGAGALRYERRWALLGAFAGVFSLWFIAAALHKYPLGAGRLSQHAAPIVCLLLGLGSTVLIRRLVEAERRPRVLVGVAACFGLVAVVGLALIIRRPYYDHEARWSRQAAQEIVAASHDEFLLVAHSPTHVIPTIRWNLVAQAGRTAWAAGDDWSALAGDRQALWVVCFLPQLANEEATAREHLSRQGALWECVERVESRLPPELKGTPFHHGRAYRFVRSDSRVAAARGERHEP